MFFTRTKNENKKSPNQNGGTEFEASKTETKPEIIDMTSQKVDPIKTIKTDSRLSGVQANDFTFNGQAAKLLIAFVSPNVDFNNVCQKLKALAPNSQVIASTTAGELCSTGGEAPYCKADGAWDNVVIQAFAPDLFTQIQTISVPLHCEDIRAGNPNKENARRIDQITQELRKFSPSFKIDSSDTFALTLVDGLSNSESYFMEAVYRSGKFPCLFIGGSAGGKLDFQATWLFDGNRVLNNHALVIFVKMAPSRRYSVMKSQKISAN